MINSLISTELGYIRCFSCEMNNDNFIRFWDEEEEEMYANNITVIKKDTSNDEIVKIINKEIKLRKKSGKNFLVIETNGRMTDDVLLKIKLKPEKVYNLDYMIIDTNKYQTMNFNNRATIKEVTTESDYRDLINISILDNAPLMGECFSTRRIHRKVSVYKSQNNNLSTFICFDGCIGIGSCEMFVQNNYAKIEDFGILKSYQKCGFGKSMIREVLKKANDNNIQFAYVVTDNEDTAKDMYIKCGFRKVAEKTQILITF